MPCLSPLKHSYFYVSLILASILIVLIGQYPGQEPAVAQDLPPVAQQVVPELHVHPLPLTLEQWQDPTNSGDYFFDIRPTSVGYLVWSSFPIKVYLEAATSASSPSLSVLPTQQQAQAWTDAVSQAIAEWSVYLPLEIVAAAEEADIAIWRRTPPLQREGGILRARSAETRYQLYIRHSDTMSDSLAHRFTLLLRPDQTPDYTQATARHELGHALGLWGHSPVATDALYFAQVRHPPPISARDVNTLKRVYEQPTRLGWSVVPNH